MQLAGSCHCGAVRFELAAAHPYPFNVCYCGVCRKTAGSGGFAINLGGDASSLRVEGEQAIRVYRARLRDPETGAETVSPAERRFCGTCGSPLWLWDPRWPELIHPHASAIDTELPTPPERTHLMLGSRAAWVHVAEGPRDRSFEEYPEESIAQWHERLGLVS